MNNIFAIESFKFSFKAFFNNIKFLLLVPFGSGLIFVGGLISSLLTASLFFIPFFVVLERIKEAVFKLATINAISMIGQTGVDQQAQSFDAWYKIFISVFYSFPYAVIFAILGVFVFVVLFVATGVIVSLGLIKISLNISDNRENKLSDLLPGFSTVIKAVCISLLLLSTLILSWLLAFLIFKVSVVFGAIAFVFSALITIFVPLKATYSSWFLIDKNTRIIESIKLSFGLNYGTRNLLILVLLFIPISLISALLSNIMNACPCFSVNLILGLLNAIFNYTFSILVMIAFGNLYRKLTVNSEKNIY